MSGTRGDEVRKHDRRLTAVVAVFVGSGQTFLELLHLGEQRLQLLSQGRVLRLQTMLFFWCHALSLPAAATRLERLRHKSEWKMLR